MSHYNTEIQVIIPAAGASARLGEPKQNVVVHDQPLWLNTLALTRHLNAPVTLVTGAWRPDRPLPDAVSELYFPHWSKGLGATIAYAVQTILPPKQGYLILLIDQWGLTETALQQFVDRWDGDTIQVSTEEAYSGPPVLFPHRYREQLLALHGDHGARALLHHEHTHRIHVPQCSWDLDTPEDLFLIQQVKEETGSFL